MFRAASSTLYLETKVASEKMQKDQNLMQTVPSAEMHDVNNAVPADATITGIAINLPGGLDDGAIQTILDATNTIAAHNPKLNDEDEIMNLADTESLLNQPDAAGSAVEEDTGTPGLPGTSSDLQL
ncbi:hypothetical protein OG21DRAFT_1517012 [Imleria badia]|nr:hypothetical protein OG21DRAFT_1517012 [Imleria badia]